MRAVDTIPHRVYAPVQACVVTKTAHTAPSIICSKPVEVASTSKWVTSIVLRKMMSNATSSNHTHYARGWGHCTGLGSVQQVDCHQTTRIAPRTPRLVRGAWVSVPHGSCDCGWLGSSIWPPIYPYCAIGTRPCQSSRFPFNVIKGGTSKGNRTRLGRPRVQRYS